MKIHIIGITAFFGNEKISNEQIEFNIVKKNKNTLKNYDNFLKTLAKSLIMG